MRAVAQRDGQGVRQKWQHPFRLLGREVDAAPVIEDQADPILAPGEGSLDEGDRPAVDGHLVVSEGSRKRNPLRIWESTLMAVVRFNAHESSFVGGGGSPPSSN